MARVLVIDDIATNRDVLIPLLHYLEHETAQASDGEEGLALVERFKPDLIICDILMPTMDGFEFVKRLRHDPIHRGTRVMFYTATFLQHEAWALARNCGVEHVITKPCEPELVLEMVAGALASPPTQADKAEALPISEAAFDAEHLRLLTGKLTSSTIQLQAANQRLAALTELCAEIAGERDPVTLLQRLCHGVRALFGARAAVLYLRQDEQGSGPACFTSGLAGATGDPWLSWAQGQAWGVDRTLDARTVRWSPARAAADLSGVPWGYREPPRHALAAPLTTPDHNLGWLMLLDSVGDHEFSAEDETTLSVHLRQVSRIYENSSLRQRLHQQVEQLQLEVAVRERAERLLELEHMVAKALAAADTYAAGYEAVVAIVCERLGWHMGRFWQVDEHRGAMTIANQWLKADSPLQVQARQTASGVLHRGIGLAGLVWQTGEPLWVPQLSHDPRLAQQAWRDSTLAGSASLFPVKVGDRVVGVLSFLSGTAQAPDEAMHHTASGVAQQLGQFIARRTAEQRLSVSERFNRATLNALADHIGVLDARGHVSAVNRAWRTFAETLTDKRWRPAEGADFFADSVIAGDGAGHAGDMRAGVREVLAGQQQEFSLECPVVDRYSNRHWFLLRVTRFDLDQRVRVVLAHKDISERKEIELRAQRLHRVTSVLSAINSLIVRVTDTHELHQEACRIAVETGRFLRVWIGLLDPVTQLPTMVAWCEGERSEGYFAQFSQVLSTHLQQDDPRFRELMLHQKPVVINDLAADNWMNLSERAESWHIRALALFPLSHQQRTIGWLALHAEEVDVFDAEECRLLSELAGDISFAMVHIQQSENMQRLAFYDPLTGCANATLFNERLSQSLAMAATVGQSLVLAILDIDGFKSINDNMGRHVGDSILEQVARRIGEVTGDPSRVARVGADQFALMLPAPPGDFALLRTSQWVYENTFASEFVVGTDTLQVSARIGLAVYPRDGDTADTLFGHAEAALKRAKGVIDRVVFYDPQISTVVAEKFDTERRLRQALQKGEFLLHYQPKYELRTGRMSSVEALIRWNSASTGLVPPAKFIPLMEETGLILEAGRWILRQAVSDRQVWLRAMGQAPRVSVNVAVKQLQDNGFLAVVQDALALGGADPGLDIEITESGFVDNVERTIAQLDSLRGMGVGLAVDDFGTGYSSLGYLARLPLTELKIDQSFVRAMLIDPASSALVSSMVSLSKALKMSCVAEGVETPEQAQRLLELDCDQVQGYLTSRPVAADAVPALFQRDATEVLRLLRGALAPEAAQLSATRSPTTG
jgi:diguanylate cyclase (GGDEF)-like protein